MSIELRILLRPSRLACASGILAILAACSTRDGTFDRPPPGFDEGGPGECSDRKCSRDLRSVLNACPDAGEAVLQTCPDDKGCGAGTCVDACESARLSKGSIGCSFWTLPPDDNENGRGACFVAMIANTWTRPVALHAELGSEPLDITKSTYTATKDGEETKYTPLEGALPPGEVALVFLSQIENPAKESTRCPTGVTPALMADPIAHGTAKTRAFHITADAPVSAYSIFPYGGAAAAYPTATLLLPESSWETTYLGVSTANVFRAVAPGDEPRTLQIVAAEDDTTIEMRPRADVLEGIDVLPASQGERQSWTLSRGQVLQFTQRENLTGSPIVANKPVGLFGGSSCVDLPSGYFYCDLTQQQLAPPSQWGSEYALVPFASRVRSLTGEVRELVPYGLVGAADGTRLSYEPERPLGAPETLDAGESVTFYSDFPVVVKSQDAGHPFHAAVYMTGSRFRGGAGHPSNPQIPEAGILGDPDFVVVVPSEQFLDRYVFFTDYTYADTSLTIVRRKTAGGFLPVELACAGEVKDWRPLGTTGEYEYTWVQLTKAFVPATFEKGTCGYGRHEATSEGPFSVTVWGIGVDASYGYPGGRGSRPINDAPPPSVD